MKILLALLAIIGLLSGVKGEEERQLQVWKWEGKGRIPMDQMTRTYPVHGFHGDYVFIVQDSSSSFASSLVSLGFSAAFSTSFPSNSPLFVLQFNPKISQLALAAFLGNEVLKKGLVAGFFEDHLAIVNSENLLDGFKFPWVEKVEFIRIRDEPITPVPTFEESPLYPTLKNMRPNPIIQRLLDNVSPSQMEREVYHLTENYHSRQSYSPGAKEAEQYIARVLNRYSFKVHVHPFLDPYSSNVCGDLEGMGEKGKKGVVIVGAHYDSRSINTQDPSLRAPGAVDNASGTAGMLEMARILSAYNGTFENDIRICLWSGEEQGLVGSDYYAKEMKERGENVLAYFNADMTGYTLPGTSVSMGMKDRQITQWLLDLSYEITNTYVPSLPVGLSPSCCSDYISFYNQGFPSIGYFQNTGSASDYPDYHKETDTYEKNNYDQMKLETQAVFAALLTFAVPL